MAFKSKKKTHKAGDLDLLPFMNLFSILIPFLLSVAVFEKLGILELNLPERSQMENPPPGEPDPMNLNLTVIIGSESMTIGAGGGFTPNFYYQEEVTYRSKSDGHVFTLPYVTNEEVKSPTDGKVMTLREKEAIDLHYVVKKDSADPGEYLTVATNSLGEPLVDTAGEFYTRIPAAGEMFQVIGAPSLRPMTAREIPTCKMGRLSVYDMVAKQLWDIHKSAMKRETPPEDIDKVTILASEKTIYDKVIHTMDAAKYGGFHQLSLSLLGGG